jgi:hypothetical protein
MQLSMDWQGNRQIGGINRSKRTMDFQGDKKPSLHAYADNSCSLKDLGAGVAASERGGVGLRQFNSKLSST